MSQLTLTHSTIRAGVWEGFVSSQDASEPDIKVTILNNEITGFTLEKTEEKQRWHLKVPIPAEAISEGVQTIFIHSGADNRLLWHFSLIAGDALGDDVRAEMDLLRAELDMLKRAFRRHCLETM